MLRCRRCRKGVIDGTCLAMVEATDEGSAAVCSIRHVNVDTLPEWILTSVQQAQWTVGKLNCQNCGARLGRFNFIDRSECPCGRDATVHLNKSRVDWDHKHYVLIVQPRTTRPARGHAGLLTDGSQNKAEKPELSRTAPDSLQLNCTAVMSHVPPAEASTSLTNTENQSFPFSPLYCISHRRRRSSEDDAAIRSSCFCPAGHSYRSAAKVTRAGTDEFTRSPVAYPTSQQFNTDVASFSAVAGRSSVSGGRRVTPDQQLLQTMEDDEPSAETVAVHEELSDSALFFRGRSTSDSAAEQEEEVVPQAFLASNRLSKREKNRLKSLRRKQRRRERWLHSQLEQEQEQEQAGSASGFLLDSEEEDREGLTCVVCLDIYFSPYSCQPCSHVFCEPCLRALAKNRPTNTPCPLCRTLISHTDFHKELDQRAKTCFPKVYYARKEHFQNSSCVKWPLPSCRKRFRTFWGYPRQTATVQRRWHFSLAGFTLDALDLADIHSVNWILAFLFFSFLMFYFYC